MKKVASALALAIAAVACGAGGSSSATTVTLLISGTPAEITSYKALISAFGKSNENIRISLDAVGSAADQVAKLSTSFSGGTPPDLFLMNFRRFGQFAAKGVLEPLGPRAEMSEEMHFADFYPQAVEAFRYKGAQVCLPTNISNQVVYFNKKLFADAGLSAPAAGWTWDDFLTTAKKLTVDTNKDGKPDVYGLGIEPALVFLAPFIWQNKAEVVDDVENPTKTDMLDAAAVDSMRFYIELRRKHHVSPTKAEMESEDLETRFASNKLGMLIESRTVTPTLRAAPDLDWDVAPLPQKQQRATMLHSDAYCMTKASKHKAEAFKFLEFALGPKGAPVLARTGRTVPSLRTVAESEAFLTPGQEPEHARVWLDQIPFILRTPVLATWAEIEAKANPIVDEWYFGTEPPEALGIEIDLATRDLFAEK